MFYSQNPHVGTTIRWWGHVIVVVAFHNLISDEIHSMLGTCGRLVEVVVDTVVVILRFYCNLYLIIAERFLVV